MWKRFKSLPWAEVGLSVVTGAVVLSFLYTSITGDGVTDGSHYTVVGRVLQGAFALGLALFAVRTIIALRKASRAVEVVRRKMVNDVEVDPGTDKPPTIDYDPRKHD